MEQALCNQNAGIEVASGWRGANGGTFDLYSGLNSNPLCRGYVEEKGNQLHDKLKEDGEEGCLTMQTEWWEGTGRARRVVEVTTVIVTVNVTIPCGAEKGHERGAPTAGARTNRERVRGWWKGTQGTDGGRGSNWGGSGGWNWHLRWRNWG